MMNETEKQELDSTTPEPAEEIVVSSEEQAEPRAEQDAQPEGSRLPLIIALLALVVAIGGAGLGYLKWVELKGAMQLEGRAVVELKERQLETKGRLDESGKTIAAQQAAFSALDDMLKQERARLQQQSVEMKESLDGVFRRIGRSSTQWIVAEAEYLMRIANHRLQLEGDAATALVALDTADGRLRDSGDPVWNGVRELLASEMAQLQAIKVLDLAGHAAKLSGLISRVEKLKLPHSGPVVGTRSQGNGETPKEFTVDAVLHDGWEGFKSLMVIRKNDRPLTAILGPEQRFFLYQNLRLQLEAARLALLRRDQLLYDSSLERAATWVAEFFDQKQAVTKTMQAGIGDLKGLQVQPALPDITKSLRMLLEQRRRNSEGQKAGS
ncbi:MAG: hypothetical protein GY753_06225 [Gammaproteobacteria bacterium]|nr:hypothetical protein [Gammaproteobacteria bacterium]